ncbi:MULTISPECIES: TIGR02530 family flagellar biosynthesis protein [Paenibacillus]|uniref:TIGR02530 family flagellar biosynthesis protein n=1 Tax=Paenibacillus TaxID=44249 RepID=UPI00203EE743|nr:TIGR02530 family flagellar biosynthesis protein [Paenibacillus camelliae]MCM3632033.1 flagellar biosynthesis protein [Paenibacillus camelliae]
MNESFRVGQLYPMKVNPGAFQQGHHNVQSNKTDKPSFSEALDREMLKFSHHAEIRMAQRGISLPQESLNQISEAVDSAAQKGAKDSLIVYRDIAMIVNVPTRTVVTALDGGQLQSNVFTQIDSAIILK